MNLVHAAPLQWGRGFDLGVVAAHLLMITSIQEGTWWHVHRLANRVDISPRSRFEAVVWSVNIAHVSSSWHPPLYFSCLAESQCHFSRNAIFVDLS